MLLTQYRDAITRGTLPPLAGDIFIINRDGIHGHTGLVRAVVGDQIQTVEGNSATAVLGSEMMRAFSESALGAPPQ